MKKMLSVLVAVVSAAIMQSVRAENALFSPLPEGYQELEWVESDGTQAVNTDYKPMGDDRVWMVAMPKTVDVSYFCARGGMANSFFGGLMLPDTTMRFDTGSSTKASTEKQSAEVKYEMDFNFDTGTVKVDGVNWITGATGKNAAERKSNLWLFALLANNSSVADQVSNKYKIRCYAFKVFHKNGLPVMNLIPCVKLDDGKVGFYDVVRNRFLGSSTETSLTPGPKASPHVVKLLQWVETTGSQYIDTGYLPVNTDTMTMRVSIAEADKESGTFFCSRTGSGDYFELILSGGGKLRMDRGVTPLSSSKTIPSYDEPHTYVVDFNAQTTTVDGENFISLHDTVAEQIQPVSLYLFALPTSANNRSPTNIGKMKLYGAKLEGKDGTLKLELYPARDETTDECGVYDAVSKKFIGFIGPSPVVEGPKQNRYQELEWVESDGTQAVNTDYKPMGDDRVWMVAMPKTVDVSYFCARGGMANSFFGGLMLPDTTMRLDTGSSTKASTEKQSAEVKYEMDFNFDTGTVKVDGINWITGASGKNAAERASHLWLFALLANNNSVVDQVSNKYKIRCYAFKVFHKDGTSVMDLVPCLDSFTGDVGFYDKVRARFIGPTTGGLLKGGDPVESSDVAFTMSVADGQADLTFAASDKSRKLYFACGNTDCGNTTFGWDQVQEVQDVAAGVTTLNDIAIPEGFGTTYRVARAILGNLYASNPQFATVPFEAKLRKVCTQAELVFSGADVTRELYVAWGDDAGEDLVNWQNKAKLCDIPAGLTEQTVDVSAQKESLRASKGCRFFLVGSSLDASDFVPTNRGLVIVVQ